MQILTSVVGKIGMAKSTTDQNVSGLFLVVYKIIVVRSWMELIHITRNTLI